MLGNLLTYKNKMKKTVIFVITVMMLLSLGMSANAQTNGKNSITASWSYLGHPLPYKAEVNHPDYLSKHLFSITYDRVVWKMLDYGLYANISQAYFDNGKKSDVFKSIFSVGVTVKAHVLPISEIKNNQLDVYLRARVGGTYIDAFGLDYGIGAGIQYFPWKHWGITAEGIFGKFVLSDVTYMFESNFQSNIGLTFRW